MAKKKTKRHDAGSLAKAEDAIHDEAIEGLEPDLLAIIERFVPSPEIRHAVRDLKTVLIRHKKRA